MNAVIAQMVFVRLDVDQMIAITLRLGSLKKSKSCDKNLACPGIQHLMYGCKSNRRPFTRWKRLQHGPVGMSGQDVGCYFSTILLIEIKALSPST